MKLQTQIPLQKQSINQIDYHSNVLLFGSCFVENIGDKLSYFKFQNLQNPFGILFQPKAIESLISNAILKKEYSETDILFSNEQWHCFDAHSKLSNPSKEVLLANLNNALLNTSKQIHESSHVVITLGTAWVYRFVESNQYVANCHKLPQKLFVKELLSVKEITNSLDSIINSIRSINKNAIVIFTVSPVRHIKDGFIENMQSKSHLITAIHQVLNKHLKSEINKSFYFPSYEIMMDELRDYRFYAEDMVHPNQLAINYIWEKFQHVWFSDKTTKTMSVIEEVQKGLKHKPFNSNSEAHKKFLKELDFKIEKIKKAVSHITFFN